MQSSFIIHVIATSFLLLSPAFVPSPSESFCVLKRTLNLFPWNKLEEQEAEGCWGLRRIPVLVTLFISWQGKGLLCIEFQGHAVNDVEEGMHVRHRGRRWKQLIASNPHSGSKGRWMLVLSAGSLFVQSGPQLWTGTASVYSLWQTTRIHLVIHQQSSMGDEVLVCVYEYYSALERIVITKFAWKWMDLEYMLLSEVIQSQKEKNCMIALICNTKPIMCIYSKINVQESTL